MKRALTIVSLISWSISAFSQCSGFQIVANKSSVCAPDIVQFRLLNPVAGSTYQWDVGNGIVSGTDTIYSFYTSADTIDAKLTISLPTGGVCTITENDILIVREKPKPDFIASNYLLCHGPGLVQFTDVTPNSAQRNWVIDGSNYALTADTISHYFVTTGYKSLDLVVVDSFGCQGVGQFIDTIEVLPDLNFDFSANIRRGCTPKTITFQLTQDPNTPYSKSYSWAFPGSNNPAGSGKSNQTRTYNNAGAFDVNLVVKLDNGCTYTTQKPGFVQFADSIPPQLKVRNAVACNDVPVYFDLVNDSLLPGDLTWDFSGIQISLDSVNSFARVGQVIDTGLLSLTVTHNYRGCVSQVSLQTLIDRDSVIADFWSPDHYHCDVPHTVHWFDDSDKGSANSLTYQWNIYDGDSSIYSSTQKDDSLTFYEFLKSYDLELIVTGDNGCTDTLRKGAYIYQDTMKLKFLPMPDIGCVGQPIFFSNNTRPTSYLSPDQYQWTFYALDDSTILDTSTENSPTVTYWDTGYYNVLLIGQNGIGCKDTLEKIDVIYIMEPELAYIIEDDQICGSDSVLLVADSKPVEINFTNYWEFIHSDTTYTYEGDTVYGKPDRAGTYTFVYSFDIEGGCFRSDTGVFYVNNLVADLLVDTLINCTPFNFSHEINIDSNYHAPNLDSTFSYQWYVEPSVGWTAQDLNAAEPGITLVQEGEYQVGLILTNSTFCSDSLLSDTLEAGLNSQFSFNRDRICKGDTLWVEAHSRDSTVLLEWSITESPNFEQITVDYNNYGFVLQDSGQFELNLRSYKPGQCSELNSQPFEIIQVVAEFSSNDTFLQCAPVYVQFQSHSINADSLIWDFGNGTKNTTTLSSAGTIYNKNTALNEGYDISLLAKNKLGCVDSAIKLDYIVVKGPLPDFEMENHEGCEPLLVKFENKSQDAVRFYLNYNDGSDLDSLGFSNHTYYNTSSELLQKVYPSLFVFDSLGCGALFVPEDPVIIFKKPNAGFIYQKEVGCLPLQLSFQDTSSDISTAVWNWNSDSISNGHIDSFVQFEAGIYSLELVVSNLYTCRDTAEEQLFFKGLPDAEIFVVDSPCLGKTTSFQANHLFNQFVDSSGVQYFWEIIEDGAIQQYASSQKTFSHRFDLPGPKTVRFITILNDGCADTASISVYIRESKEIDQASIHVVSFINNYELEIIHSEQNDPRFKEYIYEFYDNVRYSNSISADSIQTRAFNQRPDSSVCVDLRINDFCDLLGDPYNTHCFIHLKTSSPQAYQNRLEWTHYVGWDSIDHYRVLRLDGADTFEIAQVAPEVNHYVDSPLCNIEYGYIIEAVHPTSSFRSRSFMETQRPYYPMLDYYSDIENVTVERSNEILVYWDPSQSNRFDHYELLKYDDQLMELDRLQLNDTFFWDVEVQTSEQSYIYKIQERDLCDEANLKGREGKSILLTADYSSYSQLDWSAYRNWVNGVISYTVELVDPRYYEELGKTSAEVLAFQDHEHHPDVHDAYCYRVYAINDKGDTSKSNIACVKGPPLAFVPNAFTPNSDGINESFRPITTFMREGEIKGLESYYFSIYNRWGEKLFETNDLKQAWDGNYKEKPCQQDVYIFEIHCLGNDDVQYIFKGNVTLLR